MVGETGVTMEWLNYHHLFYFYMVAKLGTITRASEELMLAPPTISTQIKCLEDVLGEELFRRVGRKLVLTEMGQKVFAYAEEIFSLGSELMNVIKQRPTGHPLRINVGIADVLAKVVVRELLMPVFEMDQSVHVVCREGGLDRLLTELAHFRLDVVLSDRRVPEEVKIKTFDHKLGGCGISFYGAPALADKLRDGFPKSLHNAPAMLPTRNTELRQNLDRWFRSVKVVPKVVAEFEDTALLIAFAPDALGFFAVPSVAGESVRHRFGATLIGSTEDCREEFYAISVERKLRHPAVVAITDGAREDLFDN